MIHNSFLREDPCVEENPRFGGFRNHLLEGPLGDRNTKSKQNDTLEMIKQRNWVGNLKAWSSSWISIGLQWRFGGRENFERERVSDFSFKLLGLKLSVKIDLKLP